MTKRYSISLMLAAFMVTMLTLGIYIAIREGNVERFVEAKYQRTEPSTSLQFKAINNLPTYSPTDQVMELPFEIVNNEGVTKEYSYTTTVNIDGQLQTTKATVSVAAGEAYSSTVKYRIETPLTSAYITVQLDNSNQVIQFRTTS